MSSNLHTTLNIVCSNSFSHHSSSFFMCYMIFCNISFVFNASKKKNIKLWKVTFFFYKWWYYSNVKKWSERRNSTENLNCPFQIFLLNTLQIFSRIVVKSNDYYYKHGTEMFPLIDKMISKKLYFIFKV